MRHACCRIAPFGTPLEPLECVRDLPNPQHACLPVEIADETELPDLPALTCRLARRDYVCEKAMRRPVLPQSR